MLWVYLSPHLDDAVYSCGGLIWEQVRSGEPVQVWTLCAGEPSGPLTPYAEMLHARWETGPEAVRGRRAEDRLACEIVGAQPRHFDLPDCIYRRLPDGSPVVLSDEELFQPIKPGEQGLAAHLAGQLADLPADARLVSPLTMGGHMDHRLARAAAEASGRPLWYYADFPYVFIHRLDLREWAQPGWQVYQHRVGPLGLAAWQAGVAAYRSQISSFWPDEAAMRDQLEVYLNEFEGGYSLLADPQRSSGPILPKL